MGRPLAVKKEKTTSDSLGDIALPFSVNDPDGRLVYLTGDVSEISIAIVQQRLLQLAAQSREPIHLVVSTYGGAVHEMFSLYDVMKFVPCPVHTVALGKVMSAGSLILAAGTKGKRLIGASTRVMIHSLSSGIMGNLFEMINEVDEVKKLQDMYVERMVKETKMSEKQIRGMLSSKLDCILSAEQAIEMGIVDKVIG
jgi:ATP-dependent Clp protease protease subunit